MPDVWEQAQQQYPILRNPSYVYKSTPREGTEKLETWPPEETGTPDRPRPKEFPSDKYGIEVYNPQTRPIDILGDVVSHSLVNTDPRIKQYYSNFIGSLTPWQQLKLHEQYIWAKVNEGEQRPEEQWRNIAGLPAYFRGYPFQQWPNPSQWYTPEQIKQMDEMMNYLRGQQG